MGNIWKFIGIAKNGSRLYRNLETGVIAEETAPPRQAKPDPVAPFRVWTGNSNDTGKIRQ
jgi:hypothetical protein